MYSIGEIRTGQTLSIDGEPYLVTKAIHAKQARGAGVLKTTMKNLKTGNTIPMTFQGNEKLAPADVGFFKAQFLFNDDEGYHFMKEDDYEQFAINEDIIGENSMFLVEGESVDIQHYESMPINIRLAPTLIFPVVETVPGVKGDTAQGGTKPATLSNGLVVLVPLFVKEGDNVRVNTDTQEYMERVQ